MKTVGPFDARQCEVVFDAGQCEEDHFHAHSVFWIELQRGHAHTFKPTKPCELAYTVRFS